MTPTFSIKKPPVESIKLQKHLKAEMALFLLTGGTKIKELSNNGLAKTAKFS